MNQAPTRTPAQDPSLMDIAHRVYKCNNPPTEVRYRLDVAAGYSDAVSDLIKYAYPKHPKQVCRQILRAVLSLAGQDASAVRLISQSVAGMPVGHGALLDARGNILTAFALPAMRGDAVFDMAIRRPSNAPPYVGLRQE